MGVFIFGGIDEHDEFILHTIEPLVKCDIFVYNCLNKFDTSFVAKYMNLCEGSLVFANGNECYIYRFDGSSGSFVQFKHINGNLIKRHKKGGQSALRFARLAEESRLHYTTHIIDYIKKLDLLQNPRIVLFGSLEIANMIKSRSVTNIEFGGFLEFNSNTIKDSQKWIGVLKNKSSINPYSNIYKEIIKLLDTNPDGLDFDPSNKDQMKWWLGSEAYGQPQVDNFIPYPDSNSEYASRINIFEYIGVKYFAYEE